MLLFLALVITACGGDSDATTASAGSASDGTDTDVTAISAAPASDGDLADVTTTATGPASDGEDTDAASEAMDLPSGGFERQPEPGTYHLGAIGLPSVTFEIGDGWSITNVAGAGENSPFGATTVRVTDRQGYPGRRDLHISRPTHLLAPSFIGPARSSVVAEVDLWDVGDIRRWLEEAEAGGEWGVVEVTETEVSGHSALTFTLQPDFLGCEGMDAVAEGIGGDWTECNGGIAWDMDTDGERGGRLSVESWDGGQSEHLWIGDVEGKPLVVSLQQGYDIDEEWAGRARASKDSAAW